MLSKKIILLFLILTGLIFTSCEDEDHTNLSDINISVELLDLNTDSTIYIYGPTSIYYKIVPEIGKLHSIQFKCDDDIIKQDKSSIGTIFIDPKESDAEKNINLEIDVTIKIEAGNEFAQPTKETRFYSKKINYKIKYVRIVAEDFVVKSQEIDQIVIQMVNKNDKPCKYVFNGKEITDLDNIIFNRDRFPGTYKMKIYLLPQNALTENYYSYNHIEFIFGDKKLGNFHAGSSVDHYIDPVREELYVWSMSEIFIHDKNMNIIGHKEIPNIGELFVTPKTGLVVLQDFSGEVTTYSDKSFTSVLSTIKNIYTMNAKVTENDQLFQGHNFQFDIYDLHSGNFIYTIMLPSSILRFTISADSKYLFVKSGEKSYVYLLDTNSATLLYSFKNDYLNCYFHPINKSHVILYNNNILSKGFDIFDVETQKIIYSNKGQYQSVDPITGNLLYYDKNYGYQSGNNYENHFTDKRYHSIYTFIDNTQSTYGAYKQFNNYIIKNVSYVNMFSKLNP